MELTPLGQRNATFDSAHMRIALVATSAMSERIICLLQDSTQTESNLTVLDNTIDAYNRIILDRFDVALIDFSIGGPQAINLVQKLSNDASHTPVVLLVDRYRQSLDTFAQKAGALDWIDRRDVGGPLFRRCLRYVFTIHAMQQQLKQRAIDLHEIQETAKNGRNARTEFSELVSKELRN